jgi:hypothetical protein
MYGKLTSTICIYVPPQAHRAFKHFFSTSDQYGYQRNSVNNAINIISPFPIIDSPLPTDPTNHVNLYLQRLVGRLDAVSTKIKTLQNKLQQQNPKYDSWKARTREALQSDSESDSDERLH